MEMVRCMLFVKKLLKDFWAKAICTSIYLLNKLPIRAMKGMTPFKAWTCLKPSVKNLRIFGSISYSLISSIKRLKHDENSTKGFFVGYTTSDKRNRIHDLEAK